MPLKADLKEALHQAGFPIVGLAAPLPPPHLSTYERWIAAGHHAAMGYLSNDSARAKRADPLLVYPSARSLLLVGLPYAKPQESAWNGEGRVAAYAWGVDYHDVIPAMLKRVLSTFFTETQYRIYTDTGPILERDFAMQAGLGWIGKNTCLIHPRLGSYFLLGTVFLEVELEPDPPFSTDHCGTCRRCIEACPTGCIQPDRTIDANHCISYLTIENKGSIPTELRPQVGEWVFGCDICQTVCPWNSRPPSAPAVELGSSSPQIRLIDELSLSAPEFNRKFRGTPITRARRRGYLRNVCVALGNRADPAAVRALAQALVNDSESLVRGHAAWALGQIHFPAAIQALQQALYVEQDPAVLQEIRSALQANKP